MAKGKAKSKITITYKIASEPMSSQEVQTAERILAKMIARAYAADHPELFAPQRTQRADSTISGSAATGATGAGALPANAADPEVESGEQNGKSDFTKE